MSQLGLRKQRAQTNPVFRLTEEIKGLRTHQVLYSGRSSPSRLQFSTDIFAACVCVNAYFIVYILVVHDLHSY
jgi:hypothetical protein